MGDQGKGLRISETGMGQSSAGERPAAQRPRASSEHVECRETRGGDQRRRGGDRDLHVKYSQNFGFYSERGEATGS